MTIRKQLTVGAAALVIGLLGGVAAATWAFQMADSAGDRYAREFVSLTGLYATSEGPRPADDARQQVANALALQAVSVAQNYSIIRDQTLQQRVKDSAGVLLRAQVFDHPSDPTFAAWGRAAAECLVSNTKADAVSICANKARPSVATTPQ